LPPPLSLDPTAAQGTPRDARQRLSVMQIRRPFLFVLFLLHAFAVCAGEAGDASRLSKLDAVRENKRDKVLALTTSSFRKYIEVSPRSYTLIVLLTADKSICKPCAAMRRNFGQVATEYYNAPKKQQASHEVYFAELKVSVNDQGFLKDYSIQHVPMLYHFSRGSRNVYPKALESGPDNLNVEEMGSGMNAMKSFLNDRTRSRLRVMRTDYKIPFVPYMRAFLPFIIGLATCIGVIALSLGWTNKPFFWFMCCVIVYMYSVGGGHFSWIHDVPFAVVNSEGKTDIIANGSRSQYAAEGLIVSILCSLISAFIIMLNELPSYVSDTNAQTATGLLIACLTSALVTLLLSLHDVRTTYFSFSLSSIRSAISRGQADRSWLRTGFV
jgi:hypothetical protein